MNFIRKLVPETFRKILMIAFTLALTTGASADNYKTSIFLKAKQEVKGFGGLITRADGKLLLVGQPQNVRIFNPKKKKFEGNAYILEHESFGDDLVNIPPLPGFAGGFAVSSFLDGRIPIKLANGSVIQANPEQFFATSAATGDYNVKFSPQLLGANPIAWDSLNSQIIVGTLFDNFNLYALSPFGTIAPQAIPLSQPVSLNAFAFGPNNLLYAPNSSFDPTHPELGQIITIDVNTGVVTPFLENVDSPVALKIDSSGTIYFLERRTAKVFKWTAEHGKKLLATLKPALDNLTLSLDEKKLYVTNDEAQIFEINAKTGKWRILFESEIVQPWDLAYDSEEESLYVADFGSLKEFDVRNGKLKRILKSSAIGSPIDGQGQVAGLTVEEGPDAKIIMTDSTVGNIFVVNKSDFSLHASFSGFETGMFSRQPLSTVRVTGASPLDYYLGEYYLATDTVGGVIQKIFRSPNAPHAITSIPFASGFTTPIKLKLHNNYIYVVELGDVLHLQNNEGVVSRTALSSPSQKQILQQGLFLPEGLDIHNNKIFVLESGHERVFKASASTPGPKEVIANNIEADTGTLLMYEFSPIPFVTPFMGLATNGQDTWVVQTDNNTILHIEKK